MTFRLFIEIGNDEMLKTEHLVSALRGVANRLEDKGVLEDIQDGGVVPDGSIKDNNGNTVGGWCFDE